MADELVSELREQIKSLRDENGKRRTENKALRADKAKLEGDLARAAQQVTDLNAQVGKASPELQTQVNQLLAENRGLKHKAIFRERAIEAGVKPGAVDVLWRESGYKAETDDVDAEGMGATIAKTKESHPFLFDSPAGTGTTSAPGPAAPATPPAKPLGSDRGGLTPAGRMRVTFVQASDLAFCLANDKAMAEHRKAGTLDFVEG